MNLRLVSLTSFVLVTSFLLPACEPGQFLGPTITPSPTMTLTPTPTTTSSPTLTPTPTLTLTPTYTSTPGPLAMGRFLCSGIPISGQTVYLWQLPVPILSSNESMLIPYAEMSVAAIVTTDDKGEWRITENVPPGFYIASLLDKWPSDTKIVVFDINNVKELTYGQTLDFGDKDYSESKFCK